MSVKASLEIYFAILYYMFLSPFKNDSDLARNLLAEGIRKRKDFRLLLQKRGGFIGRAAKVIHDMDIQPQISQQQILQATSSSSSFSSPSSSSSSSFESLNLITIQHHVLLNITDVFRELADGGVRHWDPIEADELLEVMDVKNEDELIGKLNNVSDQTNNELNNGEENQDQFDAEKTQKTENTDENQDDNLRLSEDEQNKQKLKTNSKSVESLHIKDKQKIPQIEDEEDDNIVKWRTNKKNLLQYFELKGLKRLNRNNKRQFAIIDSLQEELEQLERDKLNLQLQIAGEEDRINEKLIPLQEELDRSNSENKKEKQYSQNISKKIQLLYAEIKKLKEELIFKMTEIDKLKQSEKEQTDLRRESEDQQKRWKEERDQEQSRADAVESELREFKLQNERLNQLMEQEKSARLKEFNENEDWKRKYYEELDRRLDRDNQIKILQEEKLLVIERYELEIQRLNDLYELEKEQRRIAEFENVKLNGLLAENEIDSEKLKTRIEDEQSKISEIMSLAPKLKEKEIILDENQKKIENLESSIDSEKEKRRIAENLLKIEKDEIKKQIKIAKDERIKQTEEERRRITAQIKQMMEEEDKIKVIQDQKLIIEQRDNEISKRRDVERQIKLQMLEVTKFALQVQCAHKEQERINQRLLWTESYLNINLNQEVNNNGSSIPLLTPIDLINTQINQNYNLNETPNIQNNNTNILTPLQKQQQQQQQSDSQPTLQISTPKNREAQLNDQINEDNRYEQKIVLEKDNAQIEHELIVQQGELNNQRYIAEKEQGRANQEEIRRKEAELQRGQLQGECKIVQRENLKLKNLLKQYLNEAEQLQFEEDEHIKNEKNKEMKQKEVLKHREYQSQLHKQRSGLLTTIIQEKDLEKRKIIPWQEIAKDMNKPINEENEEEVQDFQEMVEQGCETINSTLQGKRNDVKRKQIIQGGIVEGLINIFEHRDLKLVTRSQTVAFANLTAPCSTDILILLYEKQPYPGLMRLFDHQNQLIVDDAVASVFNIVCGGSSSVPETETHPHYQSMVECDGIKKLYNLFQRSADKYSKDRSALALGKLYRMKEIEDAEMKADIIGHLKSINNDDDAFTKREARAALKEIMQNPENYTVKEDDGEDCIVIE